MGQFESGKWIIGISIYLFFMFLLVFSSINTASHYDLNATGLQADDPGFLSDSTNPENSGAEYRNVTLDSSTTGNLNTIFDTLGFITGFGATNIDLGVPSGYVWIFSFLFFWIPFFMLAWSIYMALPFAH